MCMLYDRRVKSTGILPNINIVPKNVFFFFINVSTEFLVRNIFLGLCV